MQSFTLPCSDFPHMHDLLCSQEESPVEGARLHLGVQQLHPVAGIQQLLLGQPAGPLGLLQGHLHLLQLLQQQAASALRDGQLLLEVLVAPQGVVQLQLGVLQGAAGVRPEPTGRGHSRPPPQGPTVTLSWPWTVRRCFWVSASWRLEWPSWISISLRSPSIFFFNLRASFRLWISASSMLCMASVARWLFLFSCSISSSFSVTLRSSSDLTWLSSSWTRKILLSSCSKEP